MESLAHKGATFWPSSEGYDSVWVLAHYEKPSTFIKSHRTLIVPAEQPTLLAAYKSSYILYRFEFGIIKDSIPIALSQSPIGHKQQQGDLKLPEGQYYIVEKSTGPFSGAYSEFLGKRWMKLSYPNSFDAISALNRKQITTQQAATIIKASNKKQCPLQNTALGGGIGIHGWAGPWPSDTRHLTWGCISIENDQLVKLYEQVSIKTPIYIFP
jgi:murein L,D-transpeptidase YafK